MFQSFKKKTFDYRSTSSSSDDSDSSDSESDSSDSSDHHRKKKSKKSKKSKSKKKKSKSKSKRRHSSSSSDDSDQSRKFDMNNLCLSSFLIQINKIFFRNYTNYIFGVVPMLCCCFPIFLYKQDFAAFKDNTEKRIQQFPQAQFDGV